MLLPEENDLVVDMWLFKDEGYAVELKIRYDYKGNVQDILIDSDVTLNLVDDEGHSE